MLRFSILAAALCAAGCHWALTDPGTEPKSYQLDFPTGIVMDPGGRFALVANANADLSYGGGTLMMVDLFRFECTVARYRQVHQIAGPIPEQCNLGNTDVQHLYDKYVQQGMCIPDPFNPSTDHSYPAIIDCDETPFVMHSSTVKIGNFAGELKLQHENGHNRVFAAVRGDPSITFADITVPDASSMGTPDSSGLVTTDASGLINCTHSSVGPRVDKSRPPAGCATDYLVQSYICERSPMCLQPTTPDNKSTQLATEPFGIQLDEGAFDDGTKYGRLMVTHQASGQISLIDLLGGSGDTPKLTYVSNPLFQPDAQGNHGAFALAVQHPHSPTSDWYVTSNLFPQIDTFRISESNVILPEQQLSLQATYAFGNDVRDIQFEPSGNRAFVTVNHPPSLLTLDTRVLPDPNGGLPENAVVSNIDVCQTPSHMGIRRYYAPGAPGEPTQLKTRVYVVCFLSSQVMVVDPDLPDVTATIFSGIGGPNQIAFNFASVDSPDPVAELLPHRGYVTNFTESTIAVLDLQEGSPTENRVLGRIGFPPTGPQP